MFCSEINNKLKIKNNLREIRKKKNFKSKDIANFVGITTRQLQYLENGERKLTLEWATKLSEILECTPAEILGYENLGLENSNNINVNYYSDHLAKTPEKSIELTKSFLELLNITDTNIELKLNSNNKNSILIVNKDGEVLATIETNNEKDDILAHTLKHSHKGWVSLSGSNVLHASSPIKKNSNKKKK